LHEISFSGDNDYFLFTAIEASEAIEASDVVKSKTNNIKLSLTIINQENSILG
jgi:hypothetical protein